LEKIPHLTPLVLGDDYPFNLQHEQIFELLDYLKDHISDIEKISLRTAIKLAQLMCICPANWRDMADSGLLNELN